MSLTLTKMHPRVLRTTGYHHRTFSFVAKTKDDTDLVERWKQKTLSKTRVDHDLIAPSQFNLMANTLPLPSRYKHAVLPEPSTVLPPAWHLAYFPPRVPESELSADGYEKDWSPPEPFVHRMWAGGELRWSKDNPLRVGDKATMTSHLRDVQLRKGGRRGDAVFLWVDKHLNNQNGWSVTESRCWVYVKHVNEKAADASVVTAAADKPRQPSDVVKDADFSFTFTPTPKTLFRFSALTFNSHLIHYDHVYSTTIEHQKGCLTHGPLSFTLMVNQLDQQLEKDALQTNMPRRNITSFQYRCLTPLVVKDPITVLGKKNDSSSYQLWVLDHQNKLAVKGTATVE